MVTSCHVPVVGIESSNIVNKSIGFSSIQIAKGIASNGSSTLTLIVWVKLASFPQLSETIHSRTIT